MATVIIGALVFVGIGLAVYSIARSRKKSGGCGCYCDGCEKSANGKCH